MKGKEDLDGLGNEVEDDSSRRARREWKVQNPV